MLALVVLALVPVLLLEVVELSFSASVAFGVVGTVEVDDDDDDEDDDDDVAEVALVDTEGVLLPLL